MYTYFHVRLFLCTFIFIFRAYFLSSEQTITT